jgi:hypothetical protein
MLALDTGWTPDVLSAMPASFRAACHWALYARAIAGPEGIPSGEVPQGATPAVLTAALELRKLAAELRGLLFPEDVTDG